MGFRSFVTPSRPVATVPNRRYELGLYRMRSLARRLVSELCSAVAANTPARTWMPEINFPAARAVYTASVHMASNPMITTVAALAVLRLFPLIPWRRRLHMLPKPYGMGSREYPCFGPTVGRSFSSRAASQPEGPGSGGRYCRTHAPRGKVSGTGGDLVLSQTCGEPLAHVPRGTRSRIWTRYS